MQPARTQVVPHGPASISSVRAPASAAARRAAKPAVPAPITATSTSLRAATSLSLVQPEVQGLSRRRVPGRVPSCMLVAEAQALMGV